MFVFHEHKLDYFCLKLSERKPFHLEDIDFAVVTYESLTHFKEDFRMIKLRIRAIKLAQCVAVIQHVAHSLPVLLLVEQHGREAHLTKFLISLYPAD